MGGTEAFPDLGRHCQHSECNQLDFLPFKCDACRKVFCLEHRSYRLHNCPKSDNKNRKVMVCEICSASFETTGLNEDDERVLLEKHEKSGDCDPRSKKKPSCAVRRCKEILTFSNTCICQTCQLKLCLNHRFPADHSCKKAISLALPVWTEGKSNDKFLVALASRNGKDCANNARRSPSPSSTPSVKAY